MLITDREVYKPENRLYPQYTAKDRLDALKADIAHAERDVKVPPPSKPGKSMLEIAKDMGIPLSG
jgi:hypothetical protein